MWLGLMLRPLFSTPSFLQRIIRIALVCGNYDSFLMFNNTKDSFTLSACVSVCNCFLRYLPLLSVKSPIENYGTHLIADTFAVTDANENIQCEWVLSDYVCDCDIAEMGTINGTITLSDGQQKKLDGHDRNRNC